MNIILAKEYLLTRTNRIHCTDRFNTNLRPDEEKSRKYMEVNITYNFCVCIYVKLIPLTF